MSDVAAQITGKAREMGAAMAGIADVVLLRQSPSHLLLRKFGSNIDGISFSHSIRWPRGAISALIMAVSHPEDKPELDWWDAKNSPGNRIMRRINKEMSMWIEEELGIETHIINYSVLKCGAYLKDAAVLAGLGCVGRNNLLITPELGPRVRLTGMLLEKELAPTGPIDFDPCDGCEEHCRKACPQNAYEAIVLSYADTGVENLPGRDGYFSRASCLVQADKDARESGISLNETQFNGDYTKDPSLGKYLVKYCRRCEFACPVGQKGYSDEMPLIPK
jgi:epoxyqueuosine reductase